MTVLLSDFLGVPRKRFTALGVFDGFMNFDSRLHVDPHLLAASRAKEMHAAEGELKAFFGDLVRLLKVCPAKSGVVWDEVVKKLKLPEPRGVSLGYSRTSGRGSAIGIGLARLIADRAYDIVKAGNADPALFELLPLFVEDFGPDRISDVVLRVAERSFAAYTARIAKKLKLKTVRCDVRGGAFDLPVQQLDGEDQALIFVPTDVLSDLPVALSPADYAFAATYNASIRRKVNDLFAAVGVDATKPTKDELWSRAQKDPEAVKAILDGYGKVDGSPYDFRADPKAEQGRLLNAIRTAEKHPLALSKPAAGWTKGAAEKAVAEICQQFQDLVERRGLWYNFWRDGKTTKTEMAERAIQRLFYAVALTAVRNSGANLDISPETDAGSGPVDFKFSHGAAASVLVEVKKSTNPKLLHGFTTQLPTYALSAGTGAGIYLIVRMRDELAAINSVRAAHAGAKKKGKDVPRLWVVDGRQQASASKKTAPPGKTT